jgi:hypothetical protein
MRPPSFLPLTAVVLLGLGFAACANRGMYTVVGDGGGTGGAGTGGRTDGGMGDRGSGGAGGADPCATGGGGSAVADAGSCPALFNFENCSTYGATVTALFNTTDGATVQTPVTAGFRRVSHTNVASCGSGAIAIDVDFNTTSQTGGEVTIPLTGTSSSHVGETLTLRLKTDPPDGDSDTKFYVYLSTDSGYSPVLTSIPFPHDWITLSAKIVSPTEGGAPPNAFAISLEAFGGARFPYKGTIYIDEIDFRTSPPDGGAGSDASDARDGGADVPVGN